jgi:ABC-type multidrug transport system permease subunit
MGQITATWNKTLKEFLRQKTVLFWTIVWPILWVLLGSFSFVHDAPNDILASTRGAITISMMVFALMTAGMANLPGNIAQDRERGLLTKLKSMPINPLRDFCGRILALLAFSSLSAIAVIFVGYLCGAQFSYTLVELLLALGFIGLIFIASAGIGLFLGTFIKHIHGAIMTGVGLTVVSAAVSGIMTPYANLPTVLQQFARLYPISSANSSVTYLLVGIEYSGYNPVTALQLVLTMAISLTIFSVGLITYSQRCWIKE